MKWQNEEIKNLINTYKNEGSGNDRINRTVKGFVKYQRDKKSKLVNEVITRKKEAIERKLRDLIRYNFGSDYQKTLLKDKEKKKEDFTDDDIDALIKTETAFNASKTAQKTDFTDADIDALIKTETDFDASKTAQKRFLFDILSLTFNKNDEENMNKVNNMVDDFDTRYGVNWKPEVFLKFDFDFNFILEIKKSKCEGMH